MSYTDKQKSYLDEFSRNYLAAEGITRADLRESNELREHYNKALTRFILANPQIFDTDQIETARVIAETPIRELEDFGFGDAASVFFTEAVNQSERINPFSASNLQSTVLVTAAVVAVIGAVAVLK